MKNKERIDWLKSEIQKLTVIISDLEVQHIESSASIDVFSSSLEVARKALSTYTSELSELLGEKCPLVIEQEIDMINVELIKAEEDLLFEKREAQNLMALLNKTYQKKATKINSKVEKSIDKINSLAAKKRVLETKRKVEKSNNIDVVEISQFDKNKYRAKDIAFKFGYINRVKIIDFYFKNEKEDVLVVEYEKPQESTFKHNQSRRMPEGPKDFDHLKNLIFSGRNF